MPQQDEEDKHFSLPFFRTPVIGPQKRSGSPGSQQLLQDARDDDDDSASTRSTHCKEIDRHPEFHRQTEATNAELFYDLFFVANLTVFTNVHEVNDHRRLAQYVGFFCILWFTWYQVSLYDVRFSMDSVFERAARVCHFVVMIGFAITGPYFDPGAKVGADAATTTFNPFKALTIFLMVDRLVLVLQYAQMIWFTRQYRNARLLLAAIATIYLVAAMIYLGLFWTFGPDTADNKTYIAWYGVAVLETALVTFISIFYRVISFKGTHLIERMSLLTLIILGEGVMGLAKQCQTIASIQVFHFTPTTIVTIVCAIIILYFIYMLYFDWIEETHFGTIRQQIWAFLHFPLHVFLVLAVEGINQNIAWRAATVISDRLLTSITKLWSENSSSLQAITAEQWQEFASYLNSTGTKIIDDALLHGRSLEEAVNAIENRAILAHLTTTVANTTNDTIDSAIDAATLWYSTMQVMLYEMAGFSAESPSNDVTASQLSTNWSLPSIGSGSSGPSSTDDWDQTTMARVEDQNFHIVKVFRLTYVYFFVATGMVIILCAGIAALSKRKKSPGDWVRLGLTTFVGVALGSLAIIAVTATSDIHLAFENYTDSPWILPTVTLALFLVILINDVRIPKRFRRRSRKPRTKA